MKRDLIVFGEDWGGLPSSTQHLMKYLAMDRNIVWVNSIGLRRPKWNMKDMRRVLYKLSVFVRQRLTTLMNKKGMTDTFTNEQRTSQTLIEAMTVVIHSAFLCQKMV